MLLLGLVSPGRNCYSEAVGPKPQRMNMCCPMMIALTLLIVFFLGYVLEDGSGLTPEKVLGMEAEDASTGMKYLIMTWTVKEKLSSL